MWGHDEQSIRHSYPVTPRPSILVLVHSAHAPQALNNRLSSLLSRHPCPPLETGVVGHEDMSCTLDGLYVYTPPKSISSLFCSSSASSTESPYQVDDPDEINNEFQNNPQ